MELVKRERKQRDKYVFSLFTSVVLLSLLISNKVSKLLWRTWPDQSVCPKCSTAAALSFLSPRIPLQLHSTEQGKARQVVSTTCSDSKGSILTDFNKLWTKGQETLLQRLFNWGKLPEQPMMCQLWGWAGITMPPFLLRTAFEGGVEIFTCDGTVLMLLGL